MVRAMLWARALGRNDVGVGGGAGSGPAMEVEEVKMRSSAWFDQVRIAFLLSFLVKVEMNSEATLVAAAMMVYSFVCLCVRGDVCFVSVHMTLSGVCYFAQMMDVADHVIRKRGFLRRPWLCNVC
jgi:hypothetical protein